MTGCRNIDRVLSLSGRTGPRAFQHRSVEERGDGHGLQGRPQDVCQQRSDMVLLQSIQQRLEKCSLIPCCGFFFCFFFRDSDLRVSGCYGLFIPGPDPGHVTMATMNQFTTQAVELAHSRGLDETRGVTIQVDNSLKLPLYHSDCSCLKLFNQLTHI